MSINQTEDDLLEIKNINEIIQTQRYNQAGGFIVQVVTKIGEFLLIIVMAIFRGLLNLAIKLFRFRPELSTDFPFFFASDVGEALFFKFVWLAVKSGFYLAVFAFGGPIVALIAIGFMYKNLFASLKELKKEDDEPEQKAEGDDGGDGE